jgi:DNA-binding transcriptional LysR family regulator
MSIRALKTFLAIAGHGTFAAAGRALSLTQSAVSLQIQGLEKQIGAALFDRSRRGAVLTADGRALLARAAEIVALYDGMPASLAADALRGTLRIGAVPTVITGVLPGALAQLRGLHPALQVRLVAGLSAELTAQVEGGELDAALVTQPVEHLPAGLVWREFARETLMVIAPVGGKARSDAELLTSHPFIRFNRRAWAGRLIDARLRARGIVVSEAMELDSLEAITLMVQRGLGASVVPLRASDRVAPPGTVRVPFGRPPAVRPIGLVERAGHSRSRLTDALFSRLRKAGTTRTRGAG